jgi:SAM-dependent methyltransferase
MAYQTFDDQKGDSDSSAKLAAIGLPEDLTGKSLLDLGCNEGFFCREALRRGATKVVGVDSNADLLKKAALRAPGAHFHSGTWWDMPAGKYDYILFLSAIHYERNQSKLLDYLSNFLTTTGTLILECGILHEFASERMYLLDRHDGLFVYPTWRKLLEKQLSSYAVRDYGRSVMQNGDPMPRLIFHCSKKRPTVIIITAPSRSGKTVLAREFSAKGIPTIFLDAFYQQIRTESNKSPFSAAWRYFNSKFESQNNASALQEVAQEGRESLINDLVIQVINPDDSLTVVEGFNSHLVISCLISNIVLRLVVF